ncbi:hypothetical protein NXS15_03320 [Mycoplasma sp. CSL7475-4]|uniref:hypothetical protein n=1 Tax=Mycoplasma sp. CSL7475-4 TaxID=2973942 RepID=UPI00216B6763|nr:hypothetical protein [Mycoplasma sp. CSL7475-4]MCS4537142.1 hypothetical protein [Mycoplasma sp. CSL7475-4]
MSVNANQIKIKIIGIGGEGRNIINLFSFQDQNIELFEAQTDIKDFSGNENVKQINLGQGVQFKGTAGEPRIGAQCVEDNEELIKNIIKDTDLLILAAGAGGGTGSGATPIIAQYAQQMNIATLAIISMPSEDIYGKSVRRKALQGLQNIKESVNSYMVIDYSDLSDSLDLPMTSLIELPGLIANNALNVLFDIIFEKMQSNIDFNTIKNMFLHGGQILISSGQADEKDAVANALVDEAERAKFITKSDHFAQMILHIESNNATGNQISEIRKSLFKRYNLDEENLLFKTAFQTDSQAKAGSIKIAYVLAEDNRNKQKNTTTNLDIKLSQNNINSQPEIVDEVDNAFNITSEMLLIDNDVHEEEKEEKNSPQVPIFN